MQSPVPVAHPPGRRSDLLLAAALLLIAFNLRPAIAAVGPLAPVIREAMGLSHSLLGLLTTLPLLAFGTVSMLAPVLTRRYGLQGTVTGALVLLVLGVAVRSVPAVSALFTGTFLFGAGIALGNVLLPALVKQGFSKKFGLMTGLYSGMMGVGAALAAGISVPLAGSLPWAWRGALAIWAAPALLALVLWALQPASADRRLAEPSASTGARSLSGSRLAWNVALFMGLQSFAFYVVLAWLPAMLQHRGMAPEAAGWMLSLSQASGIAGSLLVPLWAGKRQDQRGIMRWLVGLEAVAILGLLFPGGGPEPLWVSLIGLVLGGSFGLALYLIVVRAPDTRTATRLSGMAQAIGYLVAATGPLLAGALFDLAGRWQPVFVLLLAVAALKLYTGLGAARPRMVPAA
ncbi:MAG: MFS transporter [Flavobacteriales bacterium]|nr:MFS transporter [Flavobacteriales bacterium]MBP9080705.1 MFS transporter [Flavobacteriales bacterium]